MHLFLAQRPPDLAVHWLHAARFYHLGPGRRRSGDVLPRAPHAGTVLAWRASQMLRACGFNTTAPSRAALGSPANLALGCVV